MIDKRDPGRAGKTLECGEIIVTTEQYANAIAAARREAIEECARVCDRLAEENQDSRYDGVLDAAQCIRSLLAGDSK